MRLRLASFEGLILTRKGIVRDSGSRSRRPPSLREVRRAARVLGADARVPLTLVHEGAIVELEHTPDVLVATKIALDHLAERLDYYGRLKRIER